jgi:hypothetical protein
VSAATISKSAQLTCSWDRPTTRKLLQIIADDPGYRHTLFGKALYKGKENRKWVATRDLCLTLFQEEAGWIASMRKKGLLKREGGRWVATDEWTGRVNDPVKGLLNRYVLQHPTFESAQGARGSIADSSS